MKKKIKFIINPNSGVKSKNHIPNLISQHLDSEKYRYEMVYTQYAGHATQLAEEAIQAGFDIIGVVGGDGSINEVARPIIHTDRTLAILPHGSGNGFAMHAGIGRDLINAITVLNTGKTVSIDTCTMNGTPFLNLAGLGFDGLVAYQLKKAKQRGFWAYFKIAIHQAFYAKSSRYAISIDDQKPMEKEAFLMEIGNGQMFGYGFTIVPKANLVDGKMNLLFVKRANKLRYLLLVPRLLVASLHRGGQLVETHTAQKIQIQFNPPVYMHYDGEGFVQQENQVTFQLHPKSLKVILPQNGRY